jgi:protein SCO1/2
MKNMNDRRRKMMARRIATMILMLVLIGAGSGGSVLAAEADATSTGADAKGCCKKPAASKETGKPRYSRSEQAYDIPDLTLRNQDNREVSLGSIFDSDKPVVVNFVFTTCTTICPVMTATFSKMYRELGNEQDGVLLVSVSIDPEYDTPSVLKKYAERWKAGDDWEFLTGDLDEINGLLKSFNAFYGDKMGHKPLYMMKQPGSDSWIRIEGLARGSDLVAEVRNLTR